MVGLSQPLVEELNESPLFISMWREFDYQLFETLLTLRKFIILLLSERTNLLLALIHFRHWEKLIVEFTQQAFPRCNRPEHVGIQPYLGFYCEEKKEKV
jgi:hypothetical protein